MSDILARVEVLVRLQDDQAKEVARLKDELASAAASLRRTECEDLPTLLQEVGLQEVTLTNGLKVTIQDDVEASVSAERMPEAVAWLAERGFDGIVKTEVTVSLGRDTREQAAEVVDVLRVGGYEPSVTQKIHPQTLKAFVLERMAAAEPVPFALFGVHPFSRAKIKRTGAKR